MDAGTRELFSPSLQGPLYRRYWCGQGGLWQGVIGMMPDGIELYESSSGDRWKLVRSATTGDPTVRHAPNQASGGRVSEVSIGDFLMRHAHSPEGRALLDLIGTLLENDRPARIAPWPDC